MIAVDIISDGLFAAIAAIGFGAISDPPMRAFPRIALLAAVGHALRYCLMHFAGFDIATASLAASFTIGMGRRARADDLPLHPGVIADGTRHLRIQNCFFIDNVHTVARQYRRRIAVYASILPQRHGSHERDNIPRGGSHIADIHIQETGVLNDTPQTLT